MVFIRVRIMEMTTKRNPKKRKKKTQQIRMKYKKLDQAQAPTTRLADDDWLSAPGDSPANARYEGLVAEGVNLVQELSFWPWGGDPVSQTAAAECMVADAEGLRACVARPTASEGARVRMRGGPTR